MSIRIIASQAVLSLLAFALSLPAWATWDGKVIVADTPASSLQGSTLSFETNGQDLPVTVEGEDEDGNAILAIPFPGNEATAGKLTIAGPGGASQTIDTPAAGAGDNIKVDTRGPGSARVQTAMPPTTRPLSVDWPKNTLSFSYGYKEIDGINPATSAVVVPASDPERPNLFGPDIKMDGGSIAYEINTGLSLPEWIDPKGHSRNLSFGIQYDFYSGDETDSAEFASGTDDTGFLYTRDLGGSTGALAGAAGAISTSTIDADYDRLELNMSWPCIRDWGNNVRVSPKLRISYTDFEYNIDSLDTFDPNLFPPNDFFVHRDQTLEQNLYELGAGARVQKIFGQSGAFDVFSGFSVNLFYSDVDLDSREEIVISGTPDQIDFSDSDSDFSVGLDLGVGAGFVFAERWRIEGVVDYRFNVPTPYAPNPTQGDLSRPPLEAESRDTNYWQARAQVSFAF